MKKQKFLSVLALASLFMAILFTSCKEDDPSPLKLSTLVAGAIDLNAAQAPTNLPVNPTIVATFNVNIDAATATSANVSMNQVYNTTNIPLNIAVAGKTITITPTANLGTGTQYQLTLGAGLMSTDDLPLTAVTRSFTTAGTFAPTGVIAHYTFEDNANDIVGTFDPSASDIVSVTYAASRNTAAGKAVVFDGDLSIIEIPNGDDLIDAANLTLSFWVKTNSTGHVDAGGNAAGHFVMGLGAFHGIGFEIYGAYDGGKFGIRYELADGTTTSEDMWYPSLATSKDNGGWQGWDYAQSLTATEMQALLKDSWLHVVLTHDGTAKKSTLYYNGVKRKSFDFDLWPEGDAKRNVVGVTFNSAATEVENKFALGFNQSRGGTLWDAEPWGGYDFTTANHFKGMLDDVRFFHKVLTATEIELMYNSEKP